MRSTTQHKDSTCDTKNDPLIQTLELSDVQYIQRSKQLKNKILQKPKKFKQLPSFLGGGGYSIS